MSTCPGGLMSSTVAELRRAGCVFAEDEARLLIEAAGTVEELRPLLRRRVNGEPLEVILGWAAFDGLRIAVQPGVFVPRQRTRFLVDLAVERARPGAVVLDLCCGTGAIGAAIVARVAGIELHCADLDPVAVRCARHNVAAAGGRVYQGDLYRPLPGSLRGRVDLLAVNAPYVPSEDIATMPPEARDHEPARALDGGPDGVAVHRRVAAEAPQWLAPGGSLLIETGAEQAPLTARAMAEHGLVPQVMVSDELYCTVVIGTLPDA
jgi:release factor glutamine methyltransferase